MPTDNSESDLDYARLSRYLAGESTARERADIDAWLAADPARRELLASLATAWETAGRTHGHQTADVDAAWNRMSAAIGRREAQPLRLPSGPAWRIAAALLVAAAGFGAWRISRPNTAPPPAGIYATAPGARELIGIGDGTTVLLGPASRLVVNAGYGKASREVTLEGEALFTVRHDAAKPFRVHAAGAVVEDLGTEFGVRAYSPTDTLRVVVTSGVVMLRRASAQDTIGVIRAGQMALLVGNGALVSQVSNARELLAWSTGQLVFDDSPMTSVAEELRRWYDVDVVVDSALASRHVSVTFSGEPIEDVTRVIAATLGARVERRDRTVTFRPAGGAK